MSVFKDVPASQIYLPPNLKGIKKVGGKRNAIIDKNYRTMPYQHPQQGEGFFGDLWDGVKSVGKKAFNIAKDTKILSTLAGAIPQTRAAAPVLHSIGLGKKKKSKAKSKTKAGGKRKRKIKK
jgi:hypothetical protein